MKAPIFLFSLPRAGSTMLQKVLMNHREITSTAEPWLLLPFYYALRKEGMLTDYNHGEGSIAFHDFVNNLPHKEADYFKSVGAFANELYDKQCANNETYFLDKTPRYYNIIPEISKSFPDAKFIFLFRNPTNIMASIIQTWSKGKLYKLKEFDKDLYYGLSALSNGYQLLNDRSYALKYEDYVVEPEKYTKEICDYLEIEYDNSMLKNFRYGEIKGVMGDPTGSKNYSEISADSLYKWKEQFYSKTRKWILSGYISNVDKEVLQVQGYSKKEIRHEIDSLPAGYKHSLVDAIDYLRSSLNIFCQNHFCSRKRTKKWREKYLLS